MNNILPPYPGGTNRNYEGVNDIFDRITLANAHALANNTFESPFALTKTQHEIFQSMIEPSILTYAKHPKNHPHPIPALLNIISYRRYHKIAEKMWKNYKFAAIDIGGSLESNNDKRVHICTKVSNYREQNRYNNAYWRINDTYSVSVAHNYNKPIICHKGAEHCKFQAPYAFSVNANYDISFDQIVSFFIMHNILIYDIAMFLPACLIDKRLNFPSDIYTCEVQNHNIIFSLGDYSFNYIHNYNNWRKYLTHTSIVTPNFTIVIEIVDTIKDFCFLRCTRVDNRIPRTICQHFKNFAHSLNKRHRNSNTLIRTIPLSKIYGEYYLIPEILKYLKNKYDVRDINKHVIMVHREFVDSVLKWSFGATDDQFKYNSFYSWARSQSSALTYDPKNLNLIIYHGVNMDINIYDTLIQNLFVYSAIQRLHRTKNIGAAFKTIRDEYEKSTIRRWIKQHFMQLLDNLLPDVEVTEETIRRVYNVLDVKITVVNRVRFSKTFTKLNFSNSGELQLDYVNDTTEVDDTTEEEAEITTEYTEQKHEKCDNTTFQHGQCAYQALHDYLRHNAQKQSIRYTYSYQEVQDYMSNATLSVMNTQPVNIMTNDATHRSMQRIISNKFNEHTTWLTDIEFGFLCYINNLNLEIHAVGCNTIINNGKQNTAIIQYVTDHWFYRKTGGYKVSAETHCNIEFAVAKPTKNYQLVHKNVTLQEKMQDIYDYITENIIIKNSEKIVDMSCAPGEFAEICKENLQRIYCYQYVGNGCQRLKKQHIHTIQYTHQKELEQYTKKHKKTDLLIYDNMISTLEVNNKFVNHFHRIITKFDAYKQLSDEHKAFINKFDVKTIIISDYSRSDSGEVYIHLEGLKDSVYNYITDNVIIKKEVLKQYAELSKDVDTLKTIDVQSSLQNKEDADITNAVSDKDNNEFYNEFFDSITIFDSKEAAIEKACNKLSLDYAGIISYELKTRNAVAGAAKTQTLLQHKKIDEYIISPILNEKLISYTVFINRMIDETLPHKPSKIIIDEVYNMMPIVVLAIINHCVKNNILIYGMGDHKQIEPYNIPDYEDKEVSIVYKLDNYHTISQRIIPQVAELLKKTMTITTTNKNGKLEVSNEIDKKELEEIKQGKRQCKVICFTQKVKEILTESKLPALTAHESQSLTISDLIIHTADISDIYHNNRIRYVYTAMSRGSNRILLYGTNNQLEIFLSVLGSNIEEALALTTPMHNTTQIYTEKTPTINCERIEIDRAPIDVNMVDHILQKTIINTNKKTNSTITSRPKFLPAFDNKVKIAIPHIAGNDIETLGSKISQFNYTRNDHSKDQLSTIQCMLQRYGKKMKQQEHMRLLERGLKNFVNVELFIKEHNNSENVVEKVYKHTVDYVINLQKKINIGDTFTTTVSESLKAQEVVQEFKEPIEYFMNCLSGKDKNAQELERAWYESGNKFVNFIMKKQDKHIVAHGKDADYKVGQGVSAWTKVQNLIFSGYCRYLQECIFQYVHKNVKLAYNASDLEISEFFMKYQNQFYDDKYINTDNDFTEIDTSHGESIIKLEMLLFGIAQMPLFIRSIYQHARTNWMMMYNNGNGVSKMWGMYCQHSGQPFTLGGNTILNMAAIGAFVDFGTILYAAFKGDDSHIRSTKSKIQKDKFGRTIEKKYGYKFKISNPEVSEFIANIITPYGFFPDVLRRTTKVISKVYENEEQWEESRVNILESIKCVRNNEHKVVGAAMAQRHYVENNIVISREEIITLYDYLTQLSTCTYQKLDFINIHKFITTYTSNFKISSI